jgi:predicted Rossmann fold flavoprotein
MSGDAHAIEETAAKWDVVVVGAGAAGLIAAAAAAERGRRTLLVEKNRKPGVKILMSGGTRCNLTQATDNRGIVEAFAGQGRFLHSALAAFGVEETIAMFESEGVETKVESTGKVFPASDRATDVLDALIRRLRRTSCVLSLGEALCQVDRDSGGFRLQTSSRFLLAERLLITSGGCSYPGCGTTGEGYAWAGRFGHAIVEPRPALVPLTTDALWPRELKGITIPDVAVKVIEPAAAPGDRDRVLAERRGSFLFTHFGLSGPVVLDVSRAVSGHARPESLTLRCDFFPATSRAELEQGLRSASSAAGKRQLANILPQQLPRRLSDALLKSAGVALDQRGAEIGHRMMSQVLDALKQVKIPIRGTCGFAKAEVTSGGVSLDEVDSRTMQSKFVENLFFAGEVLDLDGPIGGYNFQAAWSTGYLAGQRV